MKPVAFFLLIIGIGCASSRLNSVGTLTIKCISLNIEEGFDHISKLLVYADGKLVGESLPKKESEGHTVTITLSKGSHNIRAVLNSEYEGRWEEHMRVNNYSLDCQFEQVVEITNEEKIVNLEFDISQARTIIK